MNKHAEEKTNSITDSNLIRQTMNIQMLIIHILILSQFVYTDIDNTQGNVNLLKVLECLINVCFIKTLYD